jgi:diguanylate cyclase (GGDEF)-like protein/PAS domain S-box-containing protein
MNLCGPNSASERSQTKNEVDVRLSRHGWWLYLALMAAVSVAYLAGPLKAGPVFNVVGLSASIAIVVGVRKHKPSARLPWYLIALGQSLFVAGDVLAYNYQTFFGKPLPFPSIADPVYLLVAPVTVAGLLLLIRKRNPGRDWTSLVDAVIVTLGLALLSWIFLMAPYAHDAKLHLGTKLVSIAYPLADILMLGVAVRMAVGSGRRSPAFYMMISAIVALTITDSIYGWIQLHGTYSPGDLLDGGWIVYYLLMGAAALHPSMRSVSQSAAPKIRLTRLRILGIATAALIAPMIELLDPSARNGSDAIVIGGAGIILLGLVVVRMIAMARAQDAAVQRERTMREAVDALVTATSRREIVRAAEHAATMLATVEAGARVFELDQRDGARCLVAEESDEDADAVVIELAALPDEFVDQLMSRKAVEIQNGRGLLGLQAPASPMFIAPFLMQGRLEGAVALLNASGASVPLRGSLEALAAQVGLALDSALLTETVVRSETEARFSALVQHSSDVIFVLDPDTTIQYASPSVEQLFSYQASELVGRRLTDCIPQDDRERLLVAMAARASRAPGASEALEFRVAHADGRWLDTESSVTNLLENPAVRGMVVNLREITERKRFESQLTYQAFHDQVTNLPNRALFYDRVEHALTRRREHGGPIAVLFLDLDNFKSVNDTFGHIAGDGLLRTISSRLEAAVRVGDTVARLGGDEFAILLEGVEHETRVAEVVERLLEVVSMPLSVEGRDVSTHCSIGIAIASPTVEIAATADELLRNADVAMYEAKNAGGDTHRYFAAEMHASVVEQLELRAELKAAIERHELTLAYQPIFDLETDEISGYEALLRWEHDERGTITPAVFVPVAEDSGLIVPLGRWVLARACHDAVIFQRARPDRRRRTMSVNLSARQLQRAEIVDEVRDALRASGLDPRCLVLEITESMMINDVELAIERLQALRELGVLVAVDDFGTGYSSLNYIRRLPINILKIDKSFIDSVDADDEQSKLTTAIIELARVLGLRCVAEGVERPEQRDRLRQLNCDYAQGFLLARPMSAEALSELLAAGEPHLVAA